MWHYNLNMVTTSYKSIITYNKKMQIIYLIYNSLHYCIEMDEPWLWVIIIIFHNITNWYVCVTKQFMLNLKSVSK